MNISRLFIERPVMTALVMFAILLFGIVGGYLGQIGMDRIAGQVIPSAKQA